MIEKYKNIILAPLPETKFTKKEVVSRRVVVGGLIALLTFIMVVALKHGHTSVITSTLCMLLLTVVYFVFDIMTNRTSLAGSLVAAVSVPVFIAGVLSGTGGIQVLMVALLLPAILPMLAGVLHGIAASLVMETFFIILFYTPFLQRFIDSQYREIAPTYPLIFSFILIIAMRECYYQRARELNLFESHNKLQQERLVADGKSKAMIKQTILSIVNAVDARDIYTREHSSRVARYCAMFAMQLGWTTDNIEQIYQIALLHDIGKIGVDDAILKKHSSLTAEEYDQMKRHTIIGESILRDLTQLPRGGVGALYHHERFDGSGYPFGLKGEEIPIEARMIAIADSFDAMSSIRVYRDKLEPDEVMRELKQGAGTQFDPVLLEAFLPIAEKVLKEITSN